MGLKDWQYELLATSEQILSDSEDCGSEAPLTGGGATSGLLSDDNRRTTGVKACSATLLLLALFGLSSIALSSFRRSHSGNGSSETVRVLYPQPESADLYNGAKDVLNSVMGQVGVAARHGHRDELSKEDAEHPGAAQQQNLQVQGADGGAEFDCHSSLDTWVRSWTDEKKDWCCLHQGQACPTDRSSFPYDCNNFAAGWRSWSLAQKDWCCGYTRKRCPVGDADSRQADLASGDGDPSAGNLGSGLVELLVNGSTTALGNTSSFLDHQDATREVSKLEPAEVASVKDAIDDVERSLDEHAWEHTLFKIHAVVNCSADYEDWRRTWSLSKKAWCCVTAKRGCPPEEDDEETAVAAVTTTTTNTLTTLSSSSSLPSSPILAGVPEDSISPDAAAVQVTEATSTTMTLPTLPSSLSSSLPVSPSLVGVPGASVSTDTTAVQVVVMTSTMTTLTTTLSSSSSLPASPSLVNMPEASASLDAGAVEVELRGLSSGALEERACLATCSLNDIQGSCTNRMAWASEHIFFDMATKQACAAAHKMVVGACHACHGCGFSVAVDYCVQEATSSPILT